MNTIFQLLNPSNTVTVNRPLAHAIGLNEAVVYASLISKHYYYEQNNMLDAEGWFYSTVPDLEESTALSEYQQKRCIAALVKCGLIKSKNKGMPAKRSFYIIDDVELVQKFINEGLAKIGEIKPSAAESYERKRSSGSSESENQAENTSLNKAIFSCSEETAEQAPKKLQSKLLRNFGTSSEGTEEQHLSKSKNNNLNINNQNQSIYRAPELDKDNGTTMSSDMTDVIDACCCKKSSIEERESYLELIHENIEYDYLTDKSEKEKIDELVEIMLDVICSTKDTVRVNGEDVPREVVKSRFLKLDSSHVDYVLTALGKNTTDVRNIRAYLITALYNAPATIDSYYTAWVNHDMHRKFSP